MRQITTIIFVCLVALANGYGFASELTIKEREQIGLHEIQIKQVSTILKFFDVVENKDEPTAKDFFELFSEHSEAELDIVLRQDYPALYKELSPNGKSKSSEEVYALWNSNEQAKNHIDAIYLKPYSQPSRILKCFNSTYPLLFSKKTKHLIEFPPAQIGDDEENPDYFKYTVYIADEKIVFIFSSDETTISGMDYNNDDNLPYMLARTCPKDKSKKKK